MNQVFTVKECLRGYTNEALGEMCDWQQLAVSSKASRIRALEKVLRDSLHVRRVLQDVSPAGIRLLRLVAERGRMSLSDMVSMPGLLGERGVRPVVQELARRGLLLAVPDGAAGAFNFQQIENAPTNGGGTVSLVVSEGAVRQLPTAPPLEAGPAPEAEEIAAAECGETATWDFLEALRIVEVLTPRVTATGELHKADAARALEMAREAGMTTEALGMSLSMARQLGCVTTREGRLFATPHADRWTESERADRIRELLGAYLASEDITDLRLFFPQVHGTIEEHLARGTLRRTYYKRLAVELLKGHAPEAWYSVAAWIETIRRLDSNVLCLEEQWRAIHSNARGDNAAWKQQSWQTHERRLFAWMMQTFLHGLGIVDLSGDKAHYRLTALGRFALGTGERPARSEERRRDALVVQPDFEVIAYTDRCPPVLRRRLDLFCERVRSGKATTYRLTQESIYRGMRTGMAAEEFTALLEESSAKALPANVREQMATWQNKLAAVTVRRRCDILEYRSAEKAREAAARIEGARLIGERHVALNGEAPRVEARLDYGSPQLRPLRQEAGLELSAPWREVNLFLATRLSDICAVKRNDAGDLRVRLDKALLRPHDDWGLVVAQLEALAREPLAARYRLALRAWAGEVEGARTRAATLVRFDDPETCEALLELPEVREAVEGRIGLHTLVVRQGGLARLRRALKTHGIALAKSDEIVDTAPPEEWAAQWINNRQPPRDTEEGADAREAADDQRDAEDAMALPSYPPRIIREILEDAIDHRRSVLIAYQSVWSSRPAIRKVNPVALDLNGARPSLSGYCHQHGGARDFKLACITGIRVLEDETF